MEEQQLGPVQEEQEKEPADGVEAPTPIQEEDRHQHQAVIKSHKEIRSWS